MITHHFYDERKNIFSLPNSAAIKMLEFSHSDGFYLSDCLYIDKSSAIIKLDQQVLK
jgi:hypothetical protein